MKLTRSLRAALAVMLVLGALFMATTPGYAWRGWWGWPVGVGVGLAVTAPYWAGYPYYAPSYGYYRYYGYPDPYYSDPYYHDPYYPDRAYYYPY